MHTPSHPLPSLIHPAPITSPPCSSLLIPFSLLSLPFPIPAPHLPALAGVPLHTSASRKALVFPMVLLEGAFVTVCVGRTCICPAQVKDRIGPLVLFPSKVLVGCSLILTTDGLFHFLLFCTTVKQVISPPPPRIQNNLIYCSIGDLYL